MYSVVGFLVLFISLLPTVSFWSTHISFSLIFLPFTLFLIYFHILLFIHLFLNCIPFFPGAQSLFNYFGYFILICNNFTLYSNICTTYCGYTINHSCSSTVSNSSIIYFIGLYLNSLSSACQPNKIPHSNNLRNNTKNP